MDNFLLGLGHGTEHFSFFLDQGVIHIPHTKLAAGTFYLSIMHDVTVQSLMSLQPCLKCDINLLWIIILITIYFSKVKEDMVANIVQSLCDLLHIFFPSWKYVFILLLGNRKVIYIYNVTVI